MSPLTPLKGIQIRENPCLYLKINKNKFTSKEANKQKVSQQQNTVVSAVLSMPMWVVTTAHKVPHINC